MSQLMLRDRNELISGMNRRVLCAQPNRMHILHFHVRE